MASEMFFAWHSRGERYWFPFKTNQTYTTSYSLDPSLFNTAFLSLRVNRARYLTNMVVVVCCERHNPTLQALIAGTSAFTHLESLGATLALFTL
jgi:hypothetical protein